MNAVEVEQCKKYRKRILDISQRVRALHISSAFSCMEIVDCIYNDFLRPGDTFVLSKGHGSMAQYVVLEDLGIISPTDLAEYCTLQGRLGVHPEYGCPGIAASTGSLGHGLSMAVGMALADRNSTVYVVLSDGELQEGSTWEAVILASSLKLNNLVAVIDNNDLQALGRTSETHPSLYPLGEKFESFGWEVVDVDGHDSSWISSSIANRGVLKPFMIVAKTVKGKGVSWMQGVPLWHYRGLSPEEYQSAVSEIENA